METSGNLAVVRVAVQGAVSRRQIMIHRHVKSVALGNTIKTDQEHVAVVFNGYFAFGHEMDASRPN
jgi:hypothetical protein